MIGPMPTRDGDVVITQGTDRSTFAVWVVVDDGQQAPAPTAYTATAVGRAAARQMAHWLALDTKGTVYLLDATSGRWTRLADDPAAP